MNADYEMKRDVVELIIQGLRDHFPIRYRPRWNIFRLMPAGDLLGDRAEQVPVEILDRILAEFRAMPAADRLRVLNGWSEKALGVKHQDWLMWTARRPIIPCLSIRAHPGTCGVTDTLYGDFSAMDADKGPTHVQIRVGLSKHDMLEALDALKDVLDEQWDRLIADPLDEQARAERKEASNAEG